MTVRRAHAADGGVLTVRIPFQIKKRGGRKLVIAPDGVPAPAPPRARVDRALVKALGRAYRWRKLLESGAYGTIDEVATVEKINPSYVSRVLRMTLLAPDIVESILDGRQTECLTLARAMEPFPVGWPEQSVAFTRRRGISASDRG